MKKLILLAVLGLAACGPYSLSEVEKLRADNAANSFFNQTDTKSLGCSGTDSDKDSYVTCTGDKGGTQTAILCSYGEQPGCKPK